MSQENVEIVRANIDAFNRGDYDEALAVLDQDVEWHVPDVAALDAPASGMVRGRERVAEVFARWLGAWDRPSPTGPPPSKPPGCGSSPDCVRGAIEGVGP